jgi:glycosyltransferase involved in cell wall biosynthesis
MSAMSPVLLLIRSLNYGGADQQLVMLAIGLKAKGVPVRVATFYDGGTQRDELTCRDVACRSLKKRSRWDVVRFLWRWIRMARDCRPSVLYAFLGSANLMAVAAKPWLGRTKIVWSVRASNMALARYGRLERLLYWIECRLSRFADLIIVNSHAGRDYAVAHGFPSQKLIVIPNGIDVERFCPDRKAREQFRKKQGIADAESLIGLVGRIDPMKGHGNFLRAAAILLKERQDVHFICVGGGPESYRRTLLSLTEELGLSSKVTWADATVHIEIIYNALDIATCCSSYGEGFPNVIGEAMACGIPCVVTDVGDAKRIIGETGYVVGVDDPKALAAAWRDVLAMGEGEKMKWRQRTRERVIEHFGLDRLIEETSLALEIKG